MAQRFLDSAPPPTSDPVVGKDGLLTAAWREWFLRMPDTLSSIPSRLNSVELSAQSSSLSSTDFSGGALRAGLYRASYYAPVTAGSITVTFRWTDGGSSKSWASSETSGSVVFRSDAGASVTYSTSYIGSGTYSLDVVLERLRG